jgi:hypothetical protein
MHEKVWRYLELEKKLDDPSFFSRLMLVAELVFHPIGHVLFWVSFFFFPNILTYFGYIEQPSILKIGLYIFSTCQAMLAMVNGWSNMIEFYHLGTLFYVTHIKYCRTPNPFVVRSSTKSHQLFRYSSLLQNI